jgi:hypothetical protein
MSDERLRDLEQSYAAQPVVAAAECGKQEQHRARALLCYACEAKEEREHRRRTQRDRRHIKAGLIAWKDLGHFLALVSVPGCCQHCGAQFERQRRTARYCSTRCRVAAHRGSKPRSR